MTFKEFAQRIYDQFEKMQKNDKLFVADVDRDVLYNLYLDSFPAGTNEIYKTNREHDCCCCRHFIKQIGNIAAIKDGKLTSIWDVDINDDTYAPVAKAMSQYIDNAGIRDVFVTNRCTAGEKATLAPDGDNNAFFYHFHADIDRKFISYVRSIGDLQGDFRATKGVFKRSLDEISEESVNTVLELIAQNSLYRGEEWKQVLNTFKEYQKAYKKCADDKSKDLFAWEKAYESGMAVSRIRNHSMGTLLVNISNDMELDKAVRKYETIVAPANYKRPKAIFTKKMLEDAQNTVVELGLMNSLPHRFATLDDITVNNVLFSNKDSAKRIDADNPFAAMAQNVPVQAKKYSKVDTISAQDFVNKVLPTTKEVEVLFESKHQKNLVSLIAPVNKDSKKLFKWDNNFGWAYTGNMADSNIKSNVKAAGGKVDGVLRFSIQWNDNEYNPNDFDAHCIIPNNHEIYFGYRRDPVTFGELDVDIISPKRDIPAVENITWQSKSRLKPGKYQFFVHCYDNCGGRTGFKAEIEADGEIYQFAYEKELRQNERVYVADVIFDGEHFEVKPLLDASTSSKEIWGIKTNQFVPVSVICYSPNYWDQQNGVGNRHYFFMMKDCINPEQPNAMFNEYLRDDLMKHKRVFEALGGQMKVSDSKDQLSGLGFCSTCHDEVTVKVKGATERILKIVF